MENLCKISQCDALDVTNGRGATGWNEELGATEDGHQLRGGNLDETDAPTATEDGHQLRGSNLEETDAPTATEDGHQLREANLIANIKDKLCEAERINHQIKSETNFIWTAERKAELFRLLHDEVFIQENFLNPFVHLYEGKLTEKTDINLFVITSRKYHFRVCERLNMFLEQHPPGDPYKHVDYFINIMCKNNYRSLFELYGRLSPDVDWIVTKILGIIYHKVPYLRNELFEICRFNLIDFHLGVRSSNIVDGTLTFLKCAFLDNPHHPFFDPTDFFQKVILVLLQNLEDDFFLSLVKFIFRYIYFHSERVQSWEYYKMIFRYLFKYWTQAPKKKAELYAEAFLAFLDELPDHGLEYLSSFIFGKLQKVLKCADAVTFKTREILQGIIFSHRVNVLILDQFQWIRNYFRCGSQNNTSLK